MDNPSKLFRLVKHNNWTKLGAVLEVYIYSSPRVLYQGTKQKQLFQLSARCCFSDWFDCCFGQYFCFRLSLGARPQ